MRKERWTKEEEKFLLENYGKMTARQLAEELTQRFGKRRTAEAVRDKYGHLTGRRKSNRQRKKELDPFNSEDIWLVYNTLKPLLGLPDNVTNATDAAEILIERCREVTDKFG
ncbi:hypothetical protein DRP04_01780 [Archaeoglobales archaeon]|nr:MAG: hypothetical protein DRP04_01780 [Archaeoglobales archaeon]